MPIRRSLIVLLSIVPFAMAAQTATPSPRDLASLHDQVRVREITSRRFTQSELTGWLTPGVVDRTVATETVGASAEGRPITLYTYGTGSTR